MAAPLHPSPDPAPSPAADGGWLVVCLCAAWCGTCRGYQEVLEALARRQPDVRCAWIDVEDHADALGALDIDDFPTLLIAHGRTLRFFGPVLPHAATLDRSLAAARDAALTDAAALPPGVLDRVLALAPQCLV